MRIEKPVRVARTYRQRLLAEPSKVFPLLCPVREADWIEGWNPLLVITDSGFAEPDCVFITEAAPDNAIWYISKCELASGVIEMLKITPHVTACQLSIQLRPVSNETEATVTYMHTSLGPKGDAFVSSFTEEFYENFMRDWESRLNHYLVHGSRISGARA